MVGGGRISLLNWRQTAQFDDADEHAPISFGSRMRSALGTAVTLAMYCVL
jgi:hypothetical protein